MSPSDTTTPVARWPQVLGWLAVAALVITIALVAYTGPAYQAGWIDIRMAIFTLLRWCFYGAVACVVLGLAATIANAWRGSRTMAAAGVITLLVGLGLAVNFISWRNTGQSVPPIHDISTDLQDPPAFVDIVPLRADAPNPPEYAGADTAEQQRAAYPDLEPIRVAAPPAEAFGAALEVVRRMGWDLVAEVPAQGRIEATDTTRYFGFKDDVVIRVRADNGGSIIDIRSKSRVGRSDVGTNARRIRSFRDALTERL
ncbi:MAG: DUF1499 domain-containing protein [Gammaproteobacteria bacterium]|nr:DUF1499 domain-containing protein [Gammaproteobacteria bacterium]